MIMKVDSICIRSVGRNPDEPSRRDKGCYVEQRYEINNDGRRANTLSGVQKDNLILEIYED